MSPRVLRCICLSGLLLLLGACGNKGALFLPEDEMPDTQLDGQPDATDTVEAQRELNDDGVDADGAERSETTTADDERTLDKSIQRR